jgi:hypothetical protein
MRRRIVTCTLALGSLMASPSLVTAQLTSTAPACASGNSLTTLGATSCRGAFAGNNKNQTAGVLTELASFGGTWSLLGSSDDANNGPFTSNPSGSTGTLTFDNLLTGPFALILKAADSFSIYYFANAGAGVSSVSYTTAGTAVNANGIAQGLSHATVYTQLGGGGQTNVVPEPSTYVLMASGLAGLVVLSRRRRA